MTNPFLNNEIADSYDSYYEKRSGKLIDQVEKAAIFNQIKKWSSIKGDKTNKLVEVGCGTGHWTYYFAKLGFDVLGIDISGEMLKIANRKKDSYPLDNTPTFKQLNMEELSLEESFDVVAFITSLEFIENPKKAIKNAISCLKDRKGIIIFGVLNADSALAKFSENDPILSKATFYNEETLTDLIKNVASNVEISSQQCVFLSPMEMEKLSDEEIIIKESNFSEKHSIIGTFIAMKVEIQ